MNANLLNCDFCGKVFSAVNGTGASVTFRVGEWDDNAQVGSRDRKQQADYCTACLRDLCRALISSKPVSAQALLATAWKAQK